MQEMACHHKLVRMVKMVDQVMECRRRMVVQDKTVKTKACRLKTVSSLAMTRARILLLSKNDNGKKNKKKSSTNTNEQSDKNNNKSTKENKTSQS